MAETFSLIISMSVNATIGNTTGMATIYDNDGVSFANVVKPLLQSNRCTNSGCHGSGSSSGGFSFGSVSYSTVINASGVNGKIVQANNANSSNMYLKLLSPPPFGERMPRFGPYLSTLDIIKIKDWINQGAQNN
ncbi:MAG: hypothetical protein ACE5D6_03010 [Candidatus Zixiibacteriota bacterium]